VEAVWTCCAASWVELDNRWALPSAGARKRRQRVTTSSVREGGGGGTGGGVGAQEAGEAGEQGRGGHDQPFCDGMVRGIDAPSNPQLQVAISNLLLCHAYLYICQIYQNSWSFNFFTKIVNITVIIYSCPLKHTLLFFSG